MKTLWFPFSTGPTVPTALAYSRYIKAFSAIEQFTRALHTAIQTSSHYSAIQPYDTVPYSHTIQGHTAIQYRAIQPYDTGPYSHTIQHYEAKQPPYHRAIRQGPLHCHTTCSHTIAALHTLPFLQTSYFKNWSLDLTLLDYTVGNPEYVQTTPAWHIPFGF